MSVRIRRLSEEPGIEETEEGVSGVNTIWAVLKRTDLTGFSSRIFRMEPGGHTATHTHDREHVAVVVSGVCRVESIPDPVTVSSGSLITVPPNLPHSFSNPGRDRLVLLIMNMFEESDTPDAEPEKEDAEGEPAPSE
jgi:quercetin dioxygenase-like cupin family protein